MRVADLMLGLCSQYVCGVRLLILDNYSVITCDQVLTRDLDLN